MPATLSPPPSEIRRKRTGKLSETAATASTPEPAHPERVGELVDRLEDVRQHDGAGEREEPAQDGALHEAVGRAGHRGAGREERECSFDPADAASGSTSVSVERLAPARGGAARSPSFSITKSARRRSSAAGSWWLHPGEDGLARHAVAGHHAGDARLERRVHDGDVVEHAVGAGLEDERGLVDEQADAVGAGLVDEGEHPLADARGGRAR